MALMKSSRLLTILYRGSLGFLLSVTIGFLVPTPADTMSQSSSRNEVYNTIIILVIWVATCVIILILFAIRVYLSKAALRDIPKLYIPGKEEIPKRSWKLISKELDHCIAISRLLEPKTLITHPGLSPPDSNILPNVHYSDIIEGCGNVIELVACTNVNSELRRPKYMNFAEYLNSLSEWILDPKRLIPKLISLYETARFSGSPMTQEQFFNFMYYFLEVLDLFTPTADPSVNLHQPQDDDSVDFDQTLRPSSTKKS